MAAVKNVTAIALANILKSLELTAFKRFHFKMDPFHPEVSSIRDFLYHISGNRIRQTNGDCIVKTDILCNRAEPSIDITLNNDKKYRILTTNLTCLEIAQQVDRLSKLEVKAK